MKLWSKGFEPDKLIEEFTVGRDRELDLRLAKYDVEGSMAHIPLHRLWSAYQPLYPVCRLNQRCLRCPLYKE